LPEQLEVVFEEGVSVLSTALGDPGDLIERAHARGMLVISMVTTVEEAVRVAERGADVVVAQGAAEIIAEIVGEAGDRLLEVGGALAESR
jgi:NAD(P)H-dependent flavin oxidoreductase YrpB (nitropropane dioxygenase family)